MSCKWLLFLPHHASCWKATRFNGGLQHGCPPVPHRGLCAVSLRALTLEGRGGRGAFGVWGGCGAPAVNSMNPLGALMVSTTLPPFPLSFFPSAPVFSPLCLFLALSLTKLDQRTTGLGPRTGMSQLAYQGLPQRSPDPVMERKPRKQGPQNKDLCPF